MKLVVSFLSAAVLVLASGCELVVALEPPDAAVKDACPLCADVSADVNYDAPDATEDGPDDGGTEDARDATHGG